MGGTNLNAVIAFKKSLSTKVVATPLADNISPTTRKVNQYGEIEAARIQHEQKRLNDEEIQLLVTGYQSGKSTYQLAHEFGCHRITVSNILKRHGVLVSKAKSQKKLDIPDVIAMYGQDHTTQAIADKYDVDRQVVANCLKSHGIKLRGR